jgi:hypothetical protein
MKTILTVALLCVAGAFGSAQEREKVNGTFEGLLDRPIVPPFEFAEDTFTESWYSHFILLRDNTASLVGAIGIAKDLRFLNAAYREGTKKIARQIGSIRSILQNFATTWDVLVLIDGNTVFIVEPVDEKRFPHHVAIRKKDGKKSDNP